MTDVRVRLSKNAPAATMATGKTHQAGATSARANGRPPYTCSPELAPQQVGQRENGRLVMLDLATVGHRSRFADLAKLLQRLSHFSGEDRLSLGNRYLRHPPDAGGSTCALKQARPELELTRSCRSPKLYPGAPTSTTSIDTSPPHWC
jgi:hypothetical protein